MSQAAPRYTRETLDRLERFGMRLGLERMRALVAALGHPERGLRVVHVVGTNGKSSTVRMTAAALRSAGLRVGAYLSPHVLGWEERIQLDGEPLPPAVFERALARVGEAAPAVEELTGEPPTQFEALTAAAFATFWEAGVDAAVVEAGLGGRFDATNVVGAPVVGLTNVELDHTEILGETRAQILGEKLGVLHPGALLLVGALDDELLAEAVRLAHAAGALGVRRLRPQDVAAEADTVRGRYQRANAALALALARQLLAPEPLDLEQARAALRDAAPPGRLQLDDGPPPTLRDGAHNPDGMRALVGELDGLLGQRRPRVAVVAVQADKAADDLLAVLLPHVDAVVATESGHRGALPAGELAARSGAVAAEVVPDPHAALARARERAGAGGAVLVTGSLYLLAALA